MGHWFRALKVRVLLVLTLLVAVYLGISALIGSLTITPSFAALDRDQAITNLRRCVDAIEREGRSVAALCSDWGAWDDTYQFVVDGNQGFARANLVPETLENASKSNLLFILDTKGRVAAHVIYAKALGGLLHLPEFPETSWPLDHPLLQHNEPAREIRGLVATKAGLLIVASHPILTSEQKGPSRGTIVSGRFLGEDLVAGLKDDLHLDFDVRNVQADDVSAGERAILAALSDNPEGILKPVSESRQQGFTLVNDPWGRPAALLTVNLERNVITRGRLVVRYAQISNIGAAVLLLIAIYLLIQRLVLRPVAEMHRTVGEIYASGDRSLRLAVEGTDELSLLADQTNHLLAQVEASEQALLEGRQMAEEASRVKSRFLSNVSHEIRTPMNAIMGFSEAIVRASSVDAARQHAQVILRESGVLLMLIDDLLDLARLEEGKVIVERTRVDITQLLNELGQSIGIQARSKNLDLETVIKPDVPRWIWSDPLRLRQILLNLASNAIKFTEKGHVRIIVECRTENESSRLCFGVHDTGVGISRDRLSAIFDAFTQADASTTRKYGGSGLGLAIVRQLVCLMGGQVEVQSELGKGSHFSFWLPLEPVLEKDLETAKQTTIQQDIEVAARPARILLADDYPSNRDVATMFLEEAGHRVTTVTNGHEAVEACDRQAFDLIILDVQMPVMDGLMATAHIRRGSSPNTDRPILALTASADSNTRDTCMRAGFSEVITKPIRRVALLTAVAEWCGQADSDQKGPASTPMPETSGEVSGDAAPIDLETALREFGGADKLDRVLSTFMTSATGQVAALRDAIARQERPLLHSIAHAMKGGAATLEAAPLTEAAARLDSAAGAARFEELQQKVDEVAAQLERLARYVGESQSRLKGSQHAHSRG